jgi:hypothetical protein
VIGGSRSPDGAMDLDPRPAPWSRSARQASFLCSTTSPTRTIGISSCPDPGWPRWLPRLRPLPLRRSGGLKPRPSLQGGLEEFRDLWAIRSRGFARPVTRKVSKCGAVQSAPLEPGRTPWHRLVTTPGHFRNASSMGSYRKQSLNAALTEFKTRSRVQQEHFCRVLSRP